jgi:hypothetical protein
MVAVLKQIITLGKKLGEDQEVRHHGQSGPNTLLDKARREALVGWRSQHLCPSQVCPGLENHLR